ncbi:glucokinase [Podila minutissima]|uniref:Phosphotransferase n=1 Tax=Podila minutissima TaxID=64525 RepID=A0A9P5SLK3_9FUNG|nr:glucokinase [Podila minutissima]
MLYSDVSSLHSIVPQTKWSALQKEAMSTLTSQFTVSTTKLQQLTEAFVQHMNEGLTAQKGACKDLAMIPTYVTGRPDGHERGSYLALDLGGTNLRVCLITLKGDHALESHQRAFKVSDHLQEAHVSELMDFIAASIKDFITSEHISSKIVEHPSDSETLELGFTFSFPVTQTAIDAGVLLRWTKGFCCPGAVGNDVVQLLQEALNRNGVNVHVAALVNDTVGTLLAHSYTHPNTFVGAIFGTGTNGAYVETTRNIPSISSPAKEMLVNIEWGNFDKDKEFLPLTIHDNKLDKESINPGVHVFEKMISGMYLGEIARNVLLNLIGQRILFGGVSSEILNKHYALETKFMSDIEKDTSSTLTATATILEQELNIRNSTVADREIVKTVCQLVGNRAARLSAMATAAVIRQGLSNGIQEKHRHLLRVGATVVSAVDEKDVINVGIDGSVFEHYPYFEGRMTEGLEELLGPNARHIIKLGIARDGSGVGAALAALIATKNN